MQLIREYCCCAIPILNFGIYATLGEQLVVSLVAGILAFVAPPLISASVPSFAYVIFAILCFVVAAVQGLGFLGVLRESTIIFRRYTTLHCFATISVFSFAAVFIGISASKHSTVASKCVTNFFPSDTAATGTAITGADSEGQLLCNIFTWIGVGTMAGLWLVLAIFHTYLYFVISGYGATQRADHSKYYSLYSFEPAGGDSSYHPADTIGMRNLNHGAKEDPWDSRGSMDTIGFEKQPSDTSYPPPPGQFPSDATLYQQAGAANNTAYPVAARTYTPGPTYHNGYEDPYRHDATGVTGIMGRPGPHARQPTQ